MRRIPGQTPLPAAVRVAGDPGGKSQVREREKGCQQEPSREKPRNSRSMHVHFPPFSTPEPVAAPRADGTRRRIRAARRARSLPDRNGPPRETARRAGGSPRAGGPRRARSLPDRNGPPRETTPPGPMAPAGEYGRPAGRGRSPTGMDRHGKQPEGPVAPQDRWPPQPGAKSPGPVAPRADGTRRRIRAPRRARSLPDRDGPPRETARRAGGSPRADGAPPQGRWRPQGRWLPRTGGSPHEPVPP